MNLINLDVASQRAAISYNIPPFYISLLLALSLLLRHITTDLLPLMIMIGACYGRHVHVARAFRRVLERIT